ncbi:MAG: malate synthase A [bacterium]|nr:malate synthase A [bacterium]
MTLVVRGPEVPEASRVLTADALAFVEGLCVRFEARRRELLAQREARQARLAAGERPDFLAETRAVRDGSWTVPPAPADLDDRRVEITGPVDRKMIINALNSGARVFMADFEDANSPTWGNCVAGQANVQDALRRTIDFVSPEGKRYTLGPTPATLVVRPRGWHLVEKHLLRDGEPVSASLVDAGLFLFHNAAEQRRRGSGPYLYLPKMESHLEARLWNDVFVAAQETLGVPRGTVRATVLIETILAAFEMEEILHELGEHAAGLNAGRWDYIFSAIKKFRDRPDCLFPDRAQVTMTVPFMRAYTDLLVATCHRRGAHAIGGMAAFIPSRRDAEVNARAMAAVKADKEREAGAGFDGTWVAHPDLVPIAQEAFDRVLGTRPHQKDRQRDDVVPDAARLLDLRVPGGTITEAGVRNDVAVAVQYVEAWLRGSGAVALYDLMEDAATAEIARSQLWQWRKYGARLADGRVLDLDLYRALRDEEVAKLPRPAGNRIDEAAALLDRLVTSEAFAEFLTVPAYAMLP